ncbi:MAG: YcaO-like family protein [Negativicutes bacterium]|nr:YcaO-like family protein [Negativicutes bacterium]
MFSTLSRPYKERSASETIRKIRGILETHGLLPEEISTANPFPEVYSVILALPSSKGGFSTNGKGRTKEYCLASAYAEFIERLQNGVYASFSRTMQSKLYQEFGYYYDPREKFLTMQEFCELPEAVSDDLIHYTGLAKEEFIRGYFERLEFHKAPGLVAVPFHCSKSQKEVYLPLNLLLMTVGTNGMAAGNSYEEALYQALCELMERWAAARVYYNRLTPPTVPREYLEKFAAECQVIDNIEKGGKYRVIVKDFSAGRGLPAVGVILHNVQQDTYRLNVGCDTSFQVALSRGLTEVFQGFKDEDVLDQILLKIPQEYPPYFINDDEVSQESRFEVFCKFTQNGSGVFPPSLFGAEPSYQFGASAFKTRGSYGEEVAGIIEFFHSLGCSVYVRDVSFLGFPSVFVYIPEISSFGKKNVPTTHPKPTYDLIEWDKVESRICKIRHSSHDDLLSLTSTLRTLPAYSSVADLLGLKLQAGCPWSRINVSFLLAQSWFKLGNLNAAAAAFRVFQHGCPDKPEYYQAVGKYLELLAVGQSGGEARRAVDAELGRTAAVQKACDDLKDPDQFFKQIPLPECPSCSECQLKTDCLTKNLMEVSRILYPIMKKALLAQAKSA